SLLSPVPLISRTVYHTSSLHDALPIFHQLFLLPIENAYLFTSDLHATDMKTHIKNDLNKFHILTIIDKDYPASLKYINDPPLVRSEEHTSELQSRFDLVCRLLLDKKIK